MTATEADTTGRTSAWIAETVDGTLVGPAAVVVRGVAALAEAGTDQAAFLGHPKYRDKVLPSAAGVVLVPPDFSEQPPPGRAWVVCDDPSAAFSVLVEAFAPEPVSYEPGCHPTAVIAPDAEIAESAHIGAQVVVEAGVRIGAASIVAAGCIIGRETQIGSNCMLYPRVTVRERCLLGNRVIIHPGAVIGADGFGYTSGPTGHEKIPQVGIVQIDDDVEIGALTAIDRARFGRTWIQRGTKIDNLVQIAHNVVIGQHCFIVAQVGISGSTHIGNGVVFAGQAATAGHLTVGDRAIIMGKAGISKDIPPGKAMMGAPAVERREFARNQMNIKRIDRLSKTIQQLQEQIEALRRRLDA